MKRIVSITLISIILTTLNFNAKGSESADSNPATKSVNKIFLNIPNYIAPYLDQKTKDCMIEAYYSDNNSRCKNLFNEESYIEEMDSSYIKVVLSENKSWLTIKSYTTKSNDTIIAIVKTVATPSLCSDLTIFDSNLSPINSDKYITLPNIEDFFINPKSRNTKEAISLINSVCRGVDIDKDGELTVSIKQQLKEYLPNEIFDRIKPYLAPNSLKYRWNGGSYKIKK